MFFFEGLYMYLVRVTEKERKRQRSSFYWFTHQMATTAETVPS